VWVQKAELALRIGFTAEPAMGKVALDEGKAFISGKEPLADHPKMGGYPDLYNHLLAVGGGPSRISIMTAEESITRGMRWGV